MCLVVLHWDPEAPLALVLVANRDEFRQRPTQPMHWWQDQQVPMLAGKDLKAGGTWFAIDPAGRFALITNIRPGYVGKSAPLSRGELPTRFIQSGADIDSFHRSLLPQIDQYGGFNLILGDADRLFWFSSDNPEGSELEPGVQVLSNDSLNTPWPKAELAREQMKQELVTFERGQISEKVLGSTQRFANELLPKTGVPMEWESMLSAQTIIGEEYGTRSRSWLRISKAGDVRLTEAQLSDAGALHSQRHFNWQVS